MSYPSELSRCLELMVLLSKDTASVSDLSEALGVSHPTIKRDVEFARQLGADIISDRHHGYRLMNWQQIRKTVLRWRKLEAERGEVLEQGF